MLAAVREGGRRRGRGGGVLVIGDRVSGRGDRSRVGEES